MWPPASPCERACRIASASSAELRTSTTLSSEPYRTSVGAATRPRSTPSKPAPAATWAPQAARSCGFSSRTRTISPTSSSLAAGESAFRVNLPIAVSRSRAAASVSSLTVGSGTGNASLRPGVAQQSTSRSTRSGCSAARCCATRPPRLAPRTCTRIRPASSSTWSASSASMATEYGPGGASLSPMPRLS